MQTEWLRVRMPLQEGQFDPAIERAAGWIRQGELVAFPTETVYGLGADAYSEAAVARIFAAKGRPSDNPLIVHIAGLDDLRQVARAIPSPAWQLMETFWPGPLTLLFPKTDRIPALVTAGLDTVAVRMPSHPVARALLRRAGTPLAAPSANRSGRPSPTTAAHVWEDLAGRIAAVLDGGPAGIGVESTVLDLSGGKAVLLRPGGVTREAIESCIGPVDVDAEGGQQDRVPRSPGMKYLHYAPSGEMVLVAGPLEAMRRRIQQLADAEAARGVRAGVLTTVEGEPHYRAAIVIPCGSRSDLSTVAAGLYDALRQFDARGAARIFSETFPESGLGLAVMNRLRKAASHRIIRVDG
jgi:L-threonylcarbamoyladenylate synthase